MFFWAWEQHKKAQAQARKEVIEEVTEAVTEEVRKESAAQIRDLETANQQLQARISDLESRNGARRGRPYRRALRRQRAV